MFSYCFPKYYIKDLSHLKSPVQAARYAHSLKDYDENVGKFKYEEDYYVINDDGYYTMIQDNNNNK